MATLTFTESLSVANTFAVKLLSGTLNMQMDWSTGEDTFTEVVYETSGFSTNIIKTLRGCFVDVLLTKLEITDIAANQDTLAMQGEIRITTLYARRYGKEKVVATFDVKRDYLDGDEVSGWTPWQITNVKIPFGEKVIDLTCEQPDRDSEAVWGQCI